MKPCTTLALIAMLLAAATAQAQDKAQRVRAHAEHRDVKYGPDDRHIMNVWLAESRGPTPVLVSIHGGGFRSGDRSVDGPILAACLRSGISVVAITYRLTDTAIAPAQFQDGARAIQFIRSKAREWNLDPTRIAATGSSAGAGISLWLGFHDDMADPRSSDPVARQSTRLTCMAVYNGQSSYDPRFIRELFPLPDRTHLHGALVKLFDYNPAKLDQAPPEKLRLFEQVSAINFVSRGDPPALLAYSRQLDDPKPDIHHPKFGVALKKKMDALRIECQLHTGLTEGRDEKWAALVMDFIQKHFRATPARSR